MFTEGDSAGSGCGDGGKKVDGGGEGGGDKPSLFLLLFLGHLAYFVSQNQFLVVKVSFL